MNDVLSWNTALEEGHQPSEYSYQKEDIPVGIFKATLDFKIWAKKTPAINCYFTMVDTKKKILLTVYRRKSDEKYALEKSEMIFSFCPDDVVYTLATKVNSRGNLKFIEAFIED